MGWHIALLLVGLATLFLVAWTFADVVSRQCSKKKSTFFCTRNPPTEDFTCAAIDWEMNQITMVGEFIPGQTVDLVKGEDKKMTFEFHITDGSVANGEYLPENAIVLHQGSQVLMLRPANPKELILDVADLYRSLNEQRAFRPNPKSK